MVTLYLHDNKLKTLPHDMFVVLTSLINVSIHDNMLKKINVQMLNNATSDIQSLTLHGNPWNCDCEYGLPLKEWIVFNLKIVKENSDITCGDLNLPILPNSTLNFTSDLAGNLTSDHYDEEADHVSQSEDAKVIWQVDFRKCHEKNITVENPVNKDIIIIACAIGGVFIFIVALGILIFYYRELILVWLYNSPHTNWFWRPKEEVCIFYSLISPVLELKFSFSFFCQEKRGNSIFKVWINFDLHFFRNMTTWSMMDMLYPQ